MREIKFRQWQGKIQQMNYEPIIFNGSWYEDYRAFEDDISNKDIPKNNYLMQYTGLKDKNGKEIYEGDIVSHHNGLASMFKNESVKFWEGAFIAGKATSDNALVNFNVPNYVEVIGNIHENPELLENQV